MIKKLVASIFVSGLLACGSGGTTSQCATSAAIFGDSITAVPNLAADMTLLSGITITNLATPGETSTASINGGSLKYVTFMDYVDKTPEQLIIIRYGAADTVGVPSAEVTKTNVINMINYARSRGKLVVVVGVTQFTDINTYYGPGIVELANAASAAVKSAAELTSSPFVDVRLIPYIKSDVVDGVHPTKEYSDKQINLISTTISKFKCVS